jgi:hypothetical protein
MLPAGSPDSKKPHELRSILVLGLEVIFLLVLLVSLGGAPHPGQKEQIHAKYSHSPKALSSPDDERTESLSAPENSASRKTPGRVSLIGDARAPSLLALDLSGENAGSGLHDS